MVRVLDFGGFETNRVPEEGVWLCLMILLWLGLFFCLWVGRLSASKTHVPPNNVLRYYKVPSNNVSVSPEVPPINVLQIFYLVL